jgi:GWxTD domain-containing protein
VVKRYLSYLAWLALVAGMVTCTTEQKLPVKKPNKNLSYLYIPGRTPLQPEYRVYHSTDSVSLLRVKIVPNQLLFNKSGETGNYISFLDIRYRLFLVKKRSTVLADSGVVHYTVDPKKLKNKSIEKSILMRCRQGEKYVLEVVMVDQIRKTAVQNFLYVDKRTRYSFQNYMVVDVNTHKQIFSYALDSLVAFKILYRDQQPHNYFVRYFRPDERIPVPPNINVGSPLLRRAPDSAWTIHYSEREFIRLPRKGIYQFSVDSTVQDGVTLCNFGPYFPRILSPDQMAEPLAYLLTKNEMKSLMSRANRKLAVDKFWLSTTDDVEQARQLVRIYYNRVYYANIFFSTWKEGWRTDRGMIYIIYGPPDNLTKSVKREVWSYGKEKDPGRVSFTFVKVDNSFSNNVYNLLRGETTVTRWVEAIRTWRQGNIFSVGY